MCDLQGELEITDVWGQVILEADLPQKFSCQLTIGQPNLIFFSEASGGGFPLYPEILQYYTMILQLHLKFLQWQFINTYLLVNFIWA